MSFFIWKTRVFSGSQLGFKTLRWNFKMKRFSELKNMSWGICIVSRVLFCLTVHQTFVPVWVRVFVNSHSLWNRTYWNGPMLWMQNPGGLKQVVKRVAGRGVDEFSLLAINLHRWWRVHTRSIIFIRYLYTTYLWAGSNPLFDHPVEDQDERWLLVAPILLWENCTMTYMNVIYIYIHIHTYIVNK